MNLYVYPIILNDSGTNTHFMRYRYNQLFSKTVKYLLSVISRHSYREYISTYKVYCSVRGGEYLYCLRTGTETAVSVLYD